MMSVSPRERITPTTLVLLRTLCDGRLREILTAPIHGEMHTELGVLHLSELVGKQWGDVISTHKGHVFVVHKPRSPDFFRHLSRSGAPMLPKDIASIIAHTGLSKDDCVLEAGTGTGILAIYLAGIVRHVTSYEVRSDVYEKAKRNIKKLALSNVELHNRDLLEAIPEMRRRFDVIILDMSEPYRAFPQILSLLRAGGYIAVYTPYIEQAKMVHERLSGVSGATTVEVFERSITFSDKGTRPSTQRVGHSGYITYARRL
jgi:tRNA (adenine57-N1/adenine58-N1)-methyltransferase